ncbi:MAG: aldo/keto reductase [Lentisphaerae bacterium]|nr:aldo/keto reductase [Lentisphaerota bacterium]
MAPQEGCEAAQIALAWVLAQGDHIVSIPGTTKLANLQSNLASLDCHLTEENRAVLNELANQAIGDSYPPDAMAAINQ